MEPFLDMSFESIRETLKQIGFGHNESKVYLTLLKLGPSMAGRLAKEANIDRSACYDSLKALIKNTLKPMPGLLTLPLCLFRRKRFTTKPLRKIIISVIRQASTITPYNTRSFRSALILFTPSCNW